MRNTTGAKVYPCSTIQKTKSLSLALRWEIAHRSPIKVGQNLSRVLTCLEEFYPGLFDNLPQQRSVAIPIVLYLKSANEDEYIAEGTFTFFKGQHAIGFRRDEIESRKVEWSGHFLSGKTCHKFAIKTSVSRWLSRFEKVRKARWGKAFRQSRHGSKQDGNDSNPQPSQPQITPVTVKPPTAQQLRTARKQYADSLDQIFIDSGIEPTTKTTGPQVSCSWMTVKPRA
jgi:hypothetical protein